ncbi:hypothetical protein [Streptomyces sp. Y1]|uniref:Uncharacterized protein n=1 Tax=Streptomyces sp. Y1 TaxID=3238634 RepID=A0AB39TFF2_9ACTN
MRPNADPSPFDFSTDTIVAVVTAVVTTVVAEGATAVVGIVTTVGPGLVAGGDALIDLLTEPEPKPIPAPRPGDRGEKTSADVRGCSVSLRGSA